MKRRQFEPPLDSLIVAHLQQRAVEDGIALTISSLRVLNDERPRGVHDDEVCGLLISAAFGLQKLTVRIRLCVSASFQRPVRRSLLFILATRAWSALMTVGLDFTG